MRDLFDFDLRDYDPNAPQRIRPSVRGIIIQDGKVAMVHSQKFDYYKFPGGGIEPQESVLDALKREVQEESGLVVKDESIQEYGKVFRKQRGKNDVTFVQDNYYYLCSVEQQVISQNLDDYEADEHFTLEYVSPQWAIEVNRTHNHGNRDQMMLEREARVLEILIQEGYFFQAVDTSFLADAEICLKLTGKCQPDYQKKWLPAYKFNICLLDGTKIGTCDLRVGHNENVYYGGNIGYSVDETYRGHHYALKACFLLFQLAAKHQMEYVFITCKPENNASRRTCQLAGGQYIKTEQLPADNDMIKEGLSEVMIFKIPLSGVHVTAGQCMADLLQVRGLNCVPYNEAMLEGPLPEKLFDDACISKRSEYHHTSIETYRQNCHQLLDLLLHVNDTDIITAWFGDEPFCQINLLTLLAALQQRNYKGKITVQIVDENRLNLIEYYDVTDFDYEMVYQGLRNGKYIPTPNETMNQAIMTYLGE